MEKCIAAVVGNSACGPIVKLSLVEEGDPCVTIHFKDESILIIVGVTQAQRTELEEAGRPVHDDVIDSARASEVDMGRPCLRLAGQPHTDLRLQGMWSEQVDHIEFTRSTGTYGLYLALVAAGWATAIRSRIDIHGTLRLPCAQAKTSTELVRAVAMVFRKDAQPYVTVAG